MQWTLKIKSSDDYRRATRLESDDDDEEESVVREAATKQKSVREALSSGLLKIGDTFLNLSTRMTRV